MGKLTLSTRSAARKGFTLIELLVVIAIIAILAAIIIPAVMAVQGQAQDAKDLEQVRGMGNGMTLYYKKYSYFPCLVNMSDPAIASTTTAVHTAEVSAGGAGLSMKLLMSGGYVEDAKTFFSPRDAAPTNSTLSKMQVELDPKKDKTWASTYAYDVGHNPNNGAVPFFGNRKGMLQVQSWGTGHYLTCEQVAKEIDSDTSTPGLYKISNHEAGKTLSADDDIYKDDEPAFKWRDSNLVEPVATDLGP